MIKLLWTANGTLLSRLIRWSLGEPCSHFAIAFDDTVVLHSNLLGVHLSRYDAFVAGSRVIHQQELLLSPEQRLEVLCAVAQAAYGHSYDFGALAYFGWRAFLRRCFGLPFPERNRWGKGRQYLCTEIYNTIPAYVVPDVGDVGMISPERLYQMVIHHG